MKGKENKPRKDRKRRERKNRRKEKEMRRGRWKNEYGRIGGGRGDEARKVEKGMWKEKKKRT